MTETFRQYIKIRTFLGYRPKEILLELQNAFGVCEKIFINNIRKKSIDLFLGNEAPTYANVQRWSKRFRDAIDSPLGSQSNFEIQENQHVDNEDNKSNQIQKQINTNAKKTESIHSAVKTYRLA